MAQTDHHPDRIARNTSYLTLAFGLQKILSFVYFSYIARQIGEESLGKYTFALSFTVLFSILIDIGLTPVLIREVARRREDAQRYLGAIMSLKLVLAAVSYALVLVAINLLHRDALTTELVYLAGLGMLLDTMTLSFYAIFRAFQNLKYEALGTILNKVIVFTAGIVGLQLGMGPRFLILVIVVGSFFNFCYAGGLLLWKARVKPRFGWQPDVLRPLVKIALPFFIAAVFTTVYAYSDSVLLNLLAGDRFVGWYAVSYKLTFAFQILPIAVGAAIFPAMSAYFVSSRQLLAKSFERASYYLVVVAVPLALGIFALADPIILTVYTKAFEASIVPLQILILSLPFIFLNFPIGSLLNAANRQRQNTINIGIITVVNIALNVLLIPRFTFNGAAIASLISSVLLFALGLYQVTRVVDVRKLFFFKVTSKCLTAALIMGFLMLQFKDRLSFLILAPIGAVVYFVILFSIGGFATSDVVKIYRSLAKRPEANGVEHGR